MKFIETDIDGVFIVELEKISDDRGFFARAFCREQFLEQGLVGEMVQGNVSFNVLAGTIRGMHFQRQPAAEVKLVRCTRGSILDVAIDLREDSPTYLGHVSVELTADNHRALYVPENFAHGFQTLEPDTEVSYLVSAYYTPACESGLRYDDPAVGINWPLSATTVSEKDGNWPLHQ
ncbi:MAG: dTDP-4-dehydrorhamnose 3,5-epimerase [Gammaproteobacteria bacterium]|nr:dTDP-4-dehydrorhamnose 3,5-epimerase [Gammaproteobacteria bacterium]